MNASLKREIKLKSQIYKPANVKSDEDAVLKARIFNQQHFDGEQNIIYNNEMLNRMGESVIRISADPDVGAYLSEEQQKYLNDEELLTGKAKEYLLKLTKESVANDILGRIDNDMKTFLIMNFKGISDEVKKAGKNMGVEYFLRMLESKYIQFNNPVPRVPIGGIARAFVPIAPAAVVPPAAVPMGAPVVAPSPASSRASSMGLASLFPSPVAVAAPPTPVAVAPVIASPSSAFSVPMRSSSTSSFVAISTTPVGIAPPAGTAVGLTSPPAPSPSMSMIPVVGAHVGLVSTTATIGSRGATPSSRPASTSSVVHSVPSRPPTPQSATGRVSARTTPVRPSSAQSLPVSQSNVSPLTIASVAVSQARQTPSPRNYPAGAMYNHFGLGNPTTKEDFLQSLKVNLPQIPHYDALLYILNNKEFIPELSQEEIVDVIQEDVFNNWNKPDVVSFISNIAPSLIGRSGIINKTQATNMSRGELSNFLNEKFNKPVYSSSKKRSAGSVSSASRVPRPASVPNTPITGKGVYRKLIVGRGKETTTERIKDSRRYFDKLYIDLKKLDNNMLYCKYINSHTSIPNLKPQTISDDCRDMIKDIMDDKFNNKLFNQLKATDRRIIKTFVKKFKYDLDINDKDDDELQNQFNILLGEVENGNTNPDVIRKLKQYVRLAIKEGLISYQDGLVLLIELG